MNNRIIELRKLLHLSQKDFAEKIGVKQGLISAIELNKTSLTKQSIIAICSIFNVNKEWLLNGTGEIFDSKSKINKEFFALYNQLSPKFQAFLLNCSKELLKLQDDL